MRVRIALTLFVALVLALLAVPADARMNSGNPAGDPANVPDHLHVGRPRAAVTSVFDSAAEAFLILGAPDGSSPVPAPPAGHPLALVADYEAVLLPLTAGALEYELGVWRLSEGGREDLGSDGASVVAFGPSRRAGRLRVDAQLEAGLHHLVLQLTARSRAVGVADWQVDTETQDLWILVPPAAEARLPGEPQPALALPVARSIISDGSELIGATGGLFAGSQRAAASESAIGAVNFETGHNAVLLARVGQSVRVWTDYELWWSDDTSGEGRVALSILQRPVQSANQAPLAMDVEEPGSQQGPALADGSLDASFSFDRAGDYELEAVLSTRIGNGATRATDEDRVPFLVRVVEAPNVTGAIRGVVTGEGGLPLEGVAVEARGARTDAIARTRTNSGGEYLLEDLKPGDYTVSAQPDNLNYLAEWWRESPTAAGAAIVQVAGGQTIEPVDFTLTAGGTIAGRVVSADGEPLAGIEIAVGTLPFARPIRPIGPDTSSVLGDSTKPSDDLAPSAGGRARTNADGRYSIDRLPAGGYWVRAADPEGRYLTEYYDNRYAASDADVVPVATGKLHDGIDFELAGGGAIGGVVFAADPAGTAVGLPGILVEARASDDPGKVLGRTITGLGGRYRIGGLAPGAVFARASDDNGRYLEEWYDEAPDASSATRIAVDAGKTSTGIDFSLEGRTRAARLFIRPSTLGMRVGGDGELAVAVANVANLAAFEVALHWDPAVFEVSGVELGPFLGSTGRRVIPVDPEIDNASGELRYGAASVGDQPGAAGEGVLFLVRVKAREPGTTGVEFTQSVLTDPEASAIHHELAHGHVQVGRCMRGDFDCNCVVDLVDVMALVMRWGAVEGDPDYEAGYDLDSDGNIDIIDIQIEASLWGRRCSSAVTPFEEGGFGGVHAMGPASAAPHEGARLGLGLSPDRAEIGDQVTVVVNAALVRDLAGFEIELLYDPSMLRLRTAGLGELVTSSERSFQQLGPSSMDGSVSLGAFSFPGPDGPTGPGDLAWITFDVISEGTTTLRVDRATTVDSTGSALPASPAEGTLLVTTPTGASSFIPAAQRP